MATPAQLMIGGIGLLTGLITGRRALQNLRLRRKISDTATETLQPGETVTVNGPCEACGEHVTAPITGEPAVAAGVQVEKQSGTNPGWTTTDLDARGVAFELQNRGTAIEIDAEGVSFAQLEGSDAARTTTTFEDGDLPQQLWEDIDRPDRNSRRRYTEIRLGEQELTAVGDVEEATSATTCADALYRIDLSESPFGRLSDRTPDALVAAYGAGTVLKPGLVAVGALLIAGIVVL